MACSSTGEAFMQYILAIYFLICACFFLMLACCDRSHDQKRAERDELDLLQQEQLEGRETMDEIAKIMLKLSKKKDRVESAF
jgi:hypothetical protein